LRWCPLRSRSTAPWAIVPHRRDLKLGRAEPQRRTTTVTHQGPPASRTVKQSRDSRRPLPHRRTLTPDIPASTRRAPLGPLLTFPCCHAVICLSQRRSVRPNDRTSVGQVSSCRSRPS
jgi:hypothetical protein